jgi:peptidoglycan/xylan/chitin deacetylase (PgdA/CDA1 family)
VGHTPDNTTAELPPIVNGLSVDVEDWFQVGAFEEVIERGSWDSLVDRVERNVEEILALFAEADVKATFFTLGWVAQRHAKLIRRIAPSRQWAVGRRRGLVPGRRVRGSDRAR